MDEDEELILVLRARRIGGKGAEEGARCQLGGKGTGTEPTQHPLLQLERHTKLQDVAQ